MEQLQCEEQMFLSTDSKPTPAHSPLSQYRSEPGSSASPATPYYGHLAQSPAHSTDSSSDMTLSFPIDMTYSNLASNGEPPSVSMATFGVGTLTWRDKQPCTWSEEDVIMWLSHINQQPQLPSRSYNKDVEIDAFARKTGADLVQMRCDEFIRCDPQNGMFIYFGLQEQISIQKTPCDPIDLTRNSLHRHEDPSMTSLARSLLNLDDSIRRNGTQFDLRVAHTNPHIESSNHLKLGSLDLRLISFDNNDNFNSIRSVKNDSDGMVSVSAMPMPENLTQKSPKPPIEAMKKSNSTTQQIVIKPTVQDMTKVTLTPMIIDTRLGYATPLTIISSPSQEVRGNHLWEFVRDLLLDNRYNPSIIRWEDRNKGVFRLIKSDSVAKLWGERKKNPVMTYEKLSRAMRYYYQRRILERIDGKRLVYKFGPMATGWKA